MMSRSSLHSLLLLGLLCGLMTSCLEDINLDTGERILNVYCILREGPVQELELSYIAPTGGTSYSLGEGVTITLYDEGLPVGQFIRVSEKKWNLEFLPRSGHTYRLEVNVPGEDKLTAETIYPPVSTLQEVFLAHDVDVGGGTILTSASRSFKLDSDEDQILWCRFENKRDGQPFADYVATDHPYADGRGESIYTLDIHSSVWDQRFYTSGLSFYGDVFPYLHERVVRILHPAGFCRSEEKVLFAQLGEHEEVISTEEGNASMFGIFGVNKAYMSADLIVSSVSAEYDAYLIDYYYGTYDADDFTQAAYRRNHYSNIRNGTGVFGACHEYWKYLRISNNPYNNLYEMSD